MFYGKVLNIRKGDTMVIIEDSNIIKEELFSAKEVFQDIRNFLAGRFVGATRDDTLLHELIKIIFCHRISKKNNLLIPTDIIELSLFYRNLFEEIKNEFPQIFSQDEQILLDPTSIDFVNEELEKIDIFNLKRDAIGDAYEIFMGDNIKGQSGQFFTPKNAADALVSIVEPKPSDKILDFACGAGGFLISVLKYYKERNYSNTDIIKSLNNIYGIDKDEYLTRLAKIHIAAITDNVPNIKLADSLVWDLDILDNYPDDYDVILTNPPFGSKINAGSLETLSKFDLAYKWKKSDADYIRTNIINENVPPQVVFMELAIKKVKLNGKIGIVVPESLISSKKYAYVVNYIQKYCTINTVIGMPENLFKTSGKGGTHTKTALLVLTKKADIQNESENTIFFAEAQWCGNDSRGKQIDKDDIPGIISNYKSYKKGEKLENISNLGYLLNEDAIEKNILSPRFYNPDVLMKINELKDTHELIKIENLVNEGIIEFKTGDEVGKSAYGTGDIPFVRTSDISNWEIKSDPKQAVSEDIYLKYKVSQDIQEGDILMVRDGTYLIGSVALITHYDLKMLYQSHIYKIRLNSDNKYGLNPYYLLAALSSEFVQKQIKAKTFTQDIINSLGDRYLDLLIPIQKDSTKVKEISAVVEKSISERIEARELARKARIDILK